MTSCTEANLRAAMAGGGTVTFACDGTILLSNTIGTSVNTVLDGSGHLVTISGGNAVRVFYAGTNAALTLMNLTVSSGRATNGAGIFNDGGTVVMQGTSCQGNLANWVWPGTNGDGCGGAIFNRGGILMATNCLFSDNVASEWTSPITTYPPVMARSAYGGALYLLGGTCALENCRFMNNAVYGAAGSGGSSDYSSVNAGGAFGGAIFNNGALRVHNCVFSQNSICGGNGVDNSQMIPWPTMMAVPGGSGGYSGGGAICNWGQATIECSLFANNCSAGGMSGGGKNGWVDGDQPWPGGGGGNGGDGAGGAVFNGGTIALVNCTLFGNSGMGSPGGNGGGPGTFWHNGVLIYGQGGVGGSGGNGVGGICSSNTLCFCTNCTLAYNLGAAGTNGLTPYWPLPYPPNIPPGIAAGGIGFSGTFTANSIFAFNTPSNCSGVMTDGGHNLSSDASIAFAGSGSRTNINPMLGPLANNGGTTLTMALLPGSPAIDAGFATGAPATDQRGVARPQGPGVDIGAFEYQYIPVISGCLVKDLTNYWMQMSGLLPTQAFTLQASSNLLTWLDVSNCVAGTNGLFQIADPMNAKFRMKFYRLKIPTP